MKILLWSDNHFCKNSSIINSKGEKYSTRLENQIVTINWIENLFKENHCDIMIHLGDFFDKPTLDAEEISALRDIDWSMYTPRYFIVGNHEMGSQDLLFNSANALSEYGYICNKPDLIKDEYCNIIMIPYVLESNRKPLKEYVEEAFNNCGESNIDRNLPIVILTHNDIKGIQYGGFESKAGFSLEEINNNCVMLLDGHLHNETSFNIPHHQENTKVYLIGNLTGQNFSEDAFNHGHYAYILDTETLKLDKIENPYAFNFYKLDFTNKTYLGMAEVLGKLKNNAVATIKVKLQDQEELRKLVVEMKHIIKYRIIVVNDIIVTEQNTIVDTVNINHIDKFKKSFIEKEGSNEIIEEELRRL